ncbi:MAG: hypothetical protein LBC40_01180 [Dysgonamonadaceae bacterium]|jgi:hypothetical protein|nr:hypothetical protein [Dysgonamonadaceae bacterium]
MNAKSFYLSVILLTGALCASAITTYYVRCDGMDSDAGTTEATAFQTLTKVFGLSLEAGDIIDIGEGTFGYQSNKSIAVALTIKGAGKGLTFVSGTQAGAKAKSRALTVAAGADVLIEDLTFKDYGVLEEDTAFAASGGVINTTGGKLTCRRVDFTGNRAIQGGAINISNVDEIRLEDCAFSGNIAKTPASGTLTAQGGVLYINGSKKTSLVIDRCLFENNSSEYRGSIIQIVNKGDYGTTMLIQNSTFTGNHVASGGWGIYLAPSAATDAEYSFINNTFAYNTAAGTSGGAGLIVGGNASNPGTERVTFINNIVFGHTGGAASTNALSVTGKFKESRNNITNQNFDFAAKTLSGAFFDNQSGVTAEALGLAESLADNGGETKTLALAATSIAIDAGYATDALATDQTGYTRTATPDVGAYEYREGTPTPIVKHAKKSVKYSQEKGRIVFDDVKDYSKVSIFNASGQLLRAEALSGANFEYRAGAGVYVFLFEGDNGKEEHFKIVVTN